jgi:WD40 repeat protein
MLTLRLTCSYDWGNGDLPIDQAGPGISMQPQSRSQSQYHVHHVPRDPICIKAGIPYNNTAVQAHEAREANRGETSLGFSCRALRLNAAGTMCVSASSDHTLRLWDLGQQRCVGVYAVHNDAAWTVAVDEPFSRVVSGGRDGCVYKCASFPKFEPVI